MKNQRLRVKFEKALKKSSGRSVSKKKNDAYVAIWTLKKLGWSDHRIAKLKVPNSHHTIKHYHTKACDLIEQRKLPIITKDEKKIQLRYCGSSSDVEYIAGKIESECGGGKRINNINYKD